MQTIFRKSSRSLWLAALLVFCLCASSLTTASRISAVPPTVTAKSVFVFDPLSQETVWDKDADVVRPVASLTKLMTAYIVLQDTPDLSTVVQVLPSDVRRASRTFLLSGDRLSRWDLMHLMLISSDNGAARVLARTSTGGTQYFLARMNRAAEEFELTQTLFTDPAGLLPSNVSTARDIGHLLVRVAADNRITQIMQHSGHTIKLPKRVIHVASTDKLLGVMNVEAAKTGYISQSGFCIAVLVQLNSGQSLVVVLLGSASDRKRFAETEQIVSWVNNTYIQSSNLFECGPYPTSVSVEGQNFIKWHEQFSPTPYRDTIGWAVGYGMHTWKGRPVTRTYPRRVTQEQADEEFALLLPKYESIVKSSVCAPLAQSTYDALVSVSWNLGRVNTSIVNKVDAKQPVTVRDFATTATVKGQQNWKLLVRRMREFLFFSGDRAAAFDVHVKNESDAWGLYRSLRLIRVIF